MPSKKRKYNARFPAGRIKKIMQTDEEVGKVAQAVPIIISRTLELFVESLLSKAMQVTVSRNAKTLSPSHVKQCILAESRFDFLRDLVKNIPDVSAAEEKEMMSAEDSPNSSRFSDVTAPPRKIIREDSNSSSSSDVKLTQIIQTPRETTRSISSDLDSPKVHRTETVTSAVMSTDIVMDLSKKATEDVKPIRTANFYQETLLTDEVQHKSVIKVNPTYSSPQPSTSTYTTLTSIEPLQRVENPVPKPDHKVYLDLRQQNNTSAIPSPRTPTPRLPITPTPKTPTPASPRIPLTLTPRTPITSMPRTPTPTPKTPITPTPRTPITPILNIDFTKSLAKPEIKVLDAAAGNIPYSVASPKNETTLNQQKEITRQNSKSQKAEIKAVELKPNVYQPPLFNMDHINSGNLQIDEDYDT